MPCHVICTEEFGFASPGNVGRGYSGQMDLPDQAPTPEFGTRGRELPKFKGCLGNCDSDDKRGAGERTRCAERAKRSY